MNTLTIVVLAACATMAFASAIPGNPQIVESFNVVAAPEEIFETAENRHYGGGHGHYGNYGGYGHRGYGHHGGHYGGHHGGHHGHHGWHHG